MASIGKFKISSLAIFVWIFSNAFPQESIYSERKIIICHLSNNYLTQSMTIPYSALKIHLDHGDVIGACSSENSPLQLSYTKTDVRCNGENNGEIDLSIHFSQGDPPFAIQWSNGATTQDISQLQAGIYRVSVSIGNLASSAEILINEPLPLNTNSSIKNISCSGKRDGAISILPSGGTSPYSIFWSQNIVNQSGNIISNLGADLYHVSVLDERGCSAISDIIIEEPAVLNSTSLISNVKCYGGNDGNALINTAGGIPPYNYVWSSNTVAPSGNNVFSLTKGAYSYTVTDANGCLFTSDISIQEPLPLQVNFLVSDASCQPGNDGKVTANVSGGISPFAFQWSTGLTIQGPDPVIGLSEGNYNLFVTDNNGCTVSGNFSIIKENCASMLRKEDCGATVVSLAQFIYCNPVAGASNYQWEFSHSPSGFITSISRGYSLTNFHLTWVPGIQYGKSYNVRVRPFINGAWKDYGPVCQINIPGPIPGTKMRPTDCSIVTTTLNQQFFCEFVPGAQNYQWEFANAELGYQKIINRGSNSLNFTLGWVPELQYGKTYIVRVRANVGGEWGIFGEACQISLVYPIPTTKVRYYDCGITLNSLIQNIYCDAVAGATDYQWEISNDDLNFITLYTRNSVSTNFQFGWLSGLQAATSYRVRVKAKVTGEWSEFGFACQVTTPTNSIVNKQGNPEIAEAITSIYDPEIIQQLSIFPNPSKGEPISISLSGLEDSENEVSVEIYDMLGNIIFNRKSMLKDNTMLLAEINNDGELAQGIYIVNVKAQNKNHFDRIIIK